MIGHEQARVDEVRAEPRAAHGRDAGDRVVLGNEAGDGEPVE